MTRPLKLTPTRVAILLAVADGKVEHHPTWSRTPNYDYWRMPGGHTRKVTTHIRWLFRAGFIKGGPASGPSMYATKTWLLTDAGREWLAQNEEAASQ